MIQARCLYCYEPLQAEQTDFHPACSKKIFGTTSPPELPFTAEQVSTLAEQVVRSHSTLTGVQPKLSLDISKKADGSPQRFTIVSQCGRYILKPQTALYAHLPELEDLTMHLASLAKIAVVPHSLIRFKDGSLCYITKRIDRDNQGNKLHMEDMCQLTERLTERKYKGSYEQVAKKIYEYSANPKLDVVNFCEQILFCYLTGNADMHLKNFSLLKRSATEYVLSPAYDMVSTAIATPDDPEELALTLNAKKSKLKRADFEAAFKTMMLDDKTISNIFAKLTRYIPQWFSCIDKCFLPEAIKKQYKDLIAERASKMNIVP